MKHCFFGSAHLSLLHLHDVGLAVGDAVVDVVDVGSQRLHLLVERQLRLLHLWPLPQEAVPLPEDLLLPLGQFLPLLRDNTTVEAGLQPRLTSRPLAPCLCARVQSKATKLCEKIRNSVSLTATS